LDQLSLCKQYSTVSEFVFYKCSVEKGALVIVKVFQLSVIPLNSPKQDCQAVS